MRTTNNRAGGNRRMPAHDSHGPNRRASRARRLEELEYRCQVTTVCSTCKGWGMLVLQGEDLGGKPAPTRCPECGKKVSVKVYWGIRIDAV